MVGLLHWEVAALIGIPGYQSIALPPLPPAWKEEGPVLQLPQDTTGPFAWTVEVGWGGIKSKGEILLLAHVQ